MFLSNDFVIVLFAKDLAGTGWSIFFMLFCFRQKFRQNTPFSLLYVSDLNLHEKIASIYMQRARMDYSRREQKTMKWFKGR